MIPTKREIDIELAKRHVLDFTLLTMPRYKVNWHHRLLCDKLDQFADGKCPRLMVFMPPRHGKSELGSRRLPAYILGKNPDAQIIAASYAADLASRMNRDVQRIIDTPEYREIFPKTTLNSRNVKTDAKGSYIRNAEMFEVVGHRGSYRSAGVGGGITGMGADFAIIDDPIKNMEDANSPTIRQKVSDWYDSTLYTRLEGDDGSGNVLIILTRWHDDDLAGRLLTKMRKNKLADQWDILELPAVREDMQNEIDPREIGEPLWPAKYNEKRMSQIKNSVGVRIWAALYQQRPTLGDSAIFKRKYFRYYKSLPSGRPILKLISVDLAVKDKETSDFCVFSVYAKYGPDVYLIDQLRERMDFPTALTAFENFVIKHPDASIKIIEDKANGSPLLSVLKKKISGLVAVSPTHSKVVRANAVSHFYEAGNVFYPDHSIAEFDIDDHEREMTTFPLGKNDDRVDAETQALDRLMNNQADEWTGDEDEDYNETSDNLIGSMGEW